MRFDEHFLKGALTDATILYGTFPEDATFCIDTRSLQQGEIFIAFKGAQSDGHDFISEAIAKGASGIIMNRSRKEILNGISTKILENKLIVLVDNVLQSLLSLASAWRSQFNCHVVAITGSVGKTSTKQALANILYVHGARAFISAANQNTIIGLALNILKIREYHTVAVFEIGISKRGEMQRSVALLRPTTGVITCIGHCHMEGLGSLQDIASEKRDIFKYFTETSIGIINGDQPILSLVGYSHPVVRFGAKTTNQIQARKIVSREQNIDFVLKIYKKKYDVHLTKTHAGSVFNALAATAVAHFLGVPGDVIVKGIELPLEVTSRFEHRALKNAKGMIINDCYNANPESMKAALLAFENIKTSGNKIAVLGDMLELGMNSPFWHRQLGRFLRKIPSLKSVILVGDLVKWTKKTVPLGVSAEQVETWEAAVEKLSEALTGDDVILVKGSLGMKLGNLVNHFAPSVQKNNQKEQSN